MLHLATTKAVLAAMLWVGQPGHAKWSRTDIGDCGETCVAVVEELSGFRPAFNYEMSRADWPGWTRQETRAEGMARYVDIAYAITRVAHDPPPEWRNRRGVPYPARDLWRALVTISRHESAWWKSVQSGKILGLAGEHCMMQIHPDSRLGIPLETLVGTSRDASERCFRAGAMLLGRARKACEARAEGPHGWFRPTIASYGSGQGCLVDEAWVDSRVNMFAVVARPHALRDPLGLIALAIADPDDWYGSGGFLLGVDESMQLAVNLSVLGLEAPQFQFLPRGRVTGH